MTYARKKIFFSYVLSGMLFAIGGCGNSGQNSPESGPVTQIVEPIDEGQPADSEKADEFPDTTEENGGKTGELPDTTEENGGQEASQNTGNLIEEQSFSVTLRPLGQVQFASYRPDTSQDLFADVTFSIEKNGTRLQELPGVFENNCRSNESFLRVDAVSFLDYNQDGYDDIITICSYSMASGPDAAKEYSEIRYYSGSENGAFIFENEMSVAATSALTEISIETAKSFIGVGKGVSAEPWQQAYIDYLTQESEVESQEGYTLIYLDGDEIPELVEIGDCEAVGCRIVNFSDGAVHVAQLNRLHFSYLEKENLLCNSEGNMDCYYDLVYQIKDGELTLLAEGYYGAEDNSNVQYDEEGNPIYRYEWEGVEMSREDYEKALNAIYDTSRAKDGHLYGESQSVEEMISLLENFAD